jgi:hypothetical protein
MSATRIRVQLQEGRNDLKSVTLTRHGLSYLDVAMAVRTLHENSEDLFPKRNDREAYRRATDNLVRTLYRAMTGRFQAVSAGNQFREQFQATREGRTAIYRIDVEIMGMLAVR